MAKVKNALFSMEASGHVGHHLLVSRTQRGQVTRRIRLRPLNLKPLKPSEAQSLRRDLYRAGCAEWNSLSDIEKEEWIPESEARRISPFNAFMSDWLKGAAPVTGTQWDSGSTTWDGGSTTWDV